MLHTRLHINTAFFQKDKRARPGSIRTERCSVSCSYSGFGENLNLNLNLLVNGDVLLGSSTRILRQLDPEDVNTAILSKRREIFSLGVQYVAERWTPASSGDELKNKMQ
jgi:hypothetical protein